MKLIAPLSGPKEIITSSQSFYIQVLTVSIGCLEDALGEHRLPGENHLIAHLPITLMYASSSSSITSDLINMWGNQGELMRYGEEPRKYKLIGMAMSQ